MSEQDTFGTLDDPQWQVESGYSAAVASLIQQAAPILTPGGMKGATWRMTLQRLSQSLGRPMSARQRQRVLYLLGCGAAKHDHQRASGYFEDALGLALDLDDTEAIAESAFALGREHSTLQHFAESVSATEICVIAVTASGGMEADARPSLLTRTTEAMLALATCEYVRGHFDAAEHWLDQADALIHRLPNNRLFAAGSSAANRALLARARGQIEIAHRHALVALDIAEMCHEGGLRWARGLVVETTLDLAESLPGGPLGAAGRSMLAMAREYVDTPPRVPRAESRRGEAPMRLMDAVACLASIRYLRMAGAADVPDRLEAIEHVIAHAERHNGSALLGLAYTALGDDLAARNAQSPALRAYELALQAIDGHDMAAIGLRARRALLRYQEGHLEG